MYDIQRSMFSGDLSGQTIVPVYYYALYYSHFDMEIHAHPEIELMYTADKSCTVVVDGETIVLKKGELIFIDAFVPHKLFIEKGHGSRVLNLEVEVQPCQKGGAFPEGIFTALGRSQGFATLRKEQPAYFLLLDDGCVLLQYIETLHRCLNRKTDRDIVPYEAASLTFALLVSMFRRYEETVLAGGYMEGFVRQAVEYIEEHFNTELSIEMLAQYCCVSKSHLQRDFRKKTGKTIVQFIQQVRVEKAKFLLRSSNLAIIDVAVETGFNNRQHFFETFMKWTHISPSAYRNNNRNEVGLYPLENAQKDSGWQRFHKECPCTFSQFEESGFGHNPS